MNFVSRFGRYFGVVNLALLALAAYFQARGITQMIGSSLAPSGVPIGAPSRASPAKGAADDHATSARAILDRNPFDSVTARPLDAPSGASSGVPAEMVSCEGFKALIVVASSNPSWSMAVVSGGPDRGTKLVRESDEFGGKTVELVEWNRVVLSSGSARCELVMFRSEKVADAEHRPPSPGIDGGSVPREIASKIRRVGRTECDIDRAAIAEIIEKQTELMKFVRLVPVEEKGAVVGVRLLGIRPDTVLGLLGFEQGDTLQTINGFDMTSPENAMQAFARLRTADHLTVRVNRHGRDTNLDFNVK